MKALKKLVALTAMSCMALTTLAGCGGDGSDGDTVRIGLNFELSGVIANYGTPECNAAKLAINQANESKDNKFKYEYVEADNKSDSQEAISVAAKLIDQDGVHGIVGPAASGNSGAVYPVVNESKIPVVSPSATEIGITKKEDGSTFKYSFRTCFEDTTQGEAMAVFATETLKTKKAAVLTDASNPYAKGVSKAFIDRYKKLGGEIVTVLNYVEKDTDFKVQLTKIKGMDFDTIYIPGYYNEVGLIIKQAREMGITKPIIGGDGFDSTDLVKLAGAKNLNDIYFTTGYTTVNASPELQAFIDAYKKEYGEEPGLFAALAFDATNVMIQAYEEAGEINPEAATKAMAKLKFKGITGSFTFDKTHTPEKEVLVTQLVDGVQSNAVFVDPNK